MQLLIQPEVAGRKLFTNVIFSKMNVVFVFSSYKYSSNNIYTALSLPCLRYRSTLFFAWINSNKLLQGHVIIATSCQIFIFSFPTKYNQISRLDPYVENINDLIEHLPVSRRVTWWTGFCLSTRKSLPSSVQWVQNLFIYFIYKKLARIWYFFSDFGTFKTTC